MNNIIVCKSKAKNRKKNFNRKLKFDISTKFCPRYCITGRCSFLTNCPYVHDDDKIAICRKYLKAKCNSKKCHLSHNLTPDKMPDCSFFLKGCCKVENCNYRHVKVNQSSTFCDDFSKGYCPKGLQCEKSHIFLCKAFKATGSCPKGTRCNFEHKRASKKLSFKNSKYTKIINSKSNVSDKSDCLSPTTSKLINQKSIANLLLTKRLKSTNNSQQSSNCYSNANLPNINSLPEFVSLSLDGVANSSVNQFSEQINTNKNKITSIETDSKSFSVMPSKKKYFVIDIDEEKLSDYLNADSSDSNDHICRPQLKIVPDCLLRE